MHSALRRRGGRLAWAAGWVLLAAVPLAFLAVFFAWPVATMVARGFTADGALDLSGFADVLARPRTWRVIGQTLGQAAVGTALAVLLGLPAAFVLYRRSFPGRGLVRALVTVPFVLPTVVVGVAFRSLLVPTGPLGFLGLDRTFPAVVAALVFFNYAVVVRTVGGVWERLDPRAEQAARALGATPWRAFRTVTLPALGPAIASAASVVFLFCATAFGVVQVLGGPRYGTIETEIWTQTTQFLDLRAASVLSVLQLAVVTVALAVSARSRRRRERALRLEEARVTARPLRLWRDGRPTGEAVPAVVTAVVVAGLLVLPLGMLLIRSLRVDGAWSLRHYELLGSTGDANTLSATVWEATGNSLRVAVDATLLAVVVGIAVALVVSRRPRAATARRAVGVLDGLFMLPLGVSAVTVGFGLLITLDRPPFDLRSSLVLIPIAQAVVAIPLVVRTVLPVLRAIDPRQREVAAVLGAGPARVLASVDLPLVLRSLGLAVGFAFAVSLGEFGATSFLARPDRPTLPVVIFRLIGRPGEDNYGMALAASVVLGALVAAVMALAERLRPPHAGEL
ncbi:binding-protein-dependent transport systems inner membrane component [Beutenbergia cavernae DSM 12333]|uniref:Binding-protein-dependent transport systems inner membrane component n=1 Tax=Beutenbergia cavernae (strain ATCC BAA-8 / DSM 12333 / CCUG 43141 / JCM 11478 / NBRC 16432 / NCIMB 13614 / HKI 0122) TaxID=471853 RepID=C5C4C6_BEUC1|nr:iron ABC transporter permease [Beutenbergia cavernae]ACQ82050.1 binding-protein-dependent transport systems inner membrane component [Beutenbergia cavernae DSM 12333]